jgi:cytidylate kinase
MPREIIAIDGPAAAGKTTVGRRLAARLGWAFLDTGLVYRALTWLAHQHGVAPEDTAALLRLVPLLDVRAVPPQAVEGAGAVWVGGREVTRALHDPAIDADVSLVARQPAVRAALVAPQRRAVDDRPAVVVGRDIGTVIFPDARLKVYLDASPEERARRRAAELAARGVPTAPSAELAALQRRDALDRQREAAPLTVAPDAVRLVTDGLSVEDVVERIVALWAGRATPAPRAGEAVP